MPCTTLLVGKNASYDGSTIIARNEDSANGQFRPKQFIVVQPEEQPRHYTSVLSHVSIELPDDPMRYTAVPNSLRDKGIWGQNGVNEANVAMTATETITTNERVLGADPLVDLTPAVGEPGASDYIPEQPGGIGEEDLVTIVLPYIRSAREGVQRLGALLERYGTYEMNGIAFSDTDEIWWMETVGGHHWIARRVPDDCYVTMPNQLGIDELDLDDALGEQSECMCSADLREFIEANHMDLAVEPASPFNPRYAFGSHSDSDHVYNTPRAWYMQRFFNPYDEVWDGPDADHNPMSDDIPWCRQPERKVTIEDVKYALSSHYQGTAYDPYAIIGDEHTKGLFRPIGINRNDQLAVIQLRPYAPAGCRAIQWMAFGSNVYNALIPFYANVDTTPDYLSKVDDRVSTDTLYWSDRLIAALSDSAFADTAAANERYQQRIGGLGHRMIAATDEQVNRLEGADRGTGNAEVREVLQAANQSMADQLRAETDDLLGQVLYTVSLKMRNAYHMSDH
ncbi:dipeptidase A [Bifidobacterium actinocoloniiforme DSM 22766]|uniref:Dipeptidase n=1 Tax=Bifidobacterium actinocoloniiforme DSM 22766 TaxID=1437605 RepID=A0A086Z286_9BIFI|nr:C69 family dipeptidase [Bifidobacterium actinocoloniiforme]AKV55657.1 peptidase C69 [Bifidobacterium actinocoloniiforme DSM 22766]KFI40636.1 dipeptidase A [Bifidobacterium actinocoloniiforme DSM 22766]